MTDRFKPIAKELCDMINQWEPRLRGLDMEIRAGRKNRQERTIQQILGHMVDSATNNTHRIIHLQNLNCHLNYPDYANKGNNDKWIAIQRYQEEDWNLVVDLWASTNRHIAHVIEQVNEGKLGRTWVTALKEEITLEEMITDFPGHFRLHLSEIEELINQA
jgi:hypothetical protein